MKKTYNKKFITRAFTKTGIMMKTRIMPNVLAYLKSADQLLNWKERTNTQCLCIRESILPLFLTFILTAEITTRKRHLCRTTECTHLATLE